MIRLAVALAIALLTFWTCPAASISTDFTPVRGYTLVPPVGAPDFCARYPAECRPVAPAAPRFNARQLAQVVAVNRAVNAEILRRTDPDHWGLPERWDFAEDGQGDCEDFALVKRRRLEALGFPRGALLLTIVATPLGESHMVLTLHAAYGDFILDVNTNRVLPWHKTDLTFVAREEPTNTRLWRMLDGAGEGAPR